ncbi:MAG: hypothetical protein ACTHKH_03305, partial [Trinickia sp.]
HAARGDLLARRETALRRAGRAGGLLRAWLRAVLSALRTGTRARRTLLRRMLRRATARRVGATAAQRVGNRRPRRLSASAGWFAFAAR